VPLKLVHRPRSPYWIIRGSLRGIRVEESTGVSDRRAAEEIRAKREAEILAESVYGRRATATFASAALSYLEHGGERRFLEPIIRHFGVTPLAKIDQDALDRAAVKLYPHYSDSSRNRAFYTPAIAVITHAAKRKWCERLVLQRPRKGRQRTRWLLLVEANRLIAACSPHLRPLVIFMFYTGARVGEALSLDWRHVYLDRRHVVFEKTKNGEARGVPLHERVVAALANLPHRDGVPTACRTSGRSPATTRTPAVARALRRRSEAPASGLRSRILRRIVAATHGRAGTISPTAT
jgi:integrase